MSQARKITITMNDEITPPISIQKAQQEFPLQALYIVAFNEYFSEIRFKEHKVCLLECLNAMLENNPNLICFISMPQEEEDDCLELVSKYLGEDSAIEKKIRQQIKDEYWVPEFLEDCKKNSIKTVHLGGVYGRACVWDAARSMADNVYAKQLGDGHPNMRFADTAEIYRFDNAVILGHVTEGYTDCDLTFDQFVLFPGTKLFTVDLGDDTDVVALAEDQYSGDVGESYELYTEEYLENYYALHVRVQEFLNSPESKDRNRMFAMHSAQAASDTTEEAKSIEKLASPKMK